MAIKKASQGRLTIPYDIWNLVNFENEKDFGFFLIDDSKIVISPISNEEMKNYEILGTCHFDDKHRFFIPQNVDFYLGIGDLYLFSTYLSNKKIYIRKRSSITAFVDSTC